MHPTLSRPRRLLAALLAASLLAATSATAQTPTAAPRSYAVLSLLGNRLDVVTYQPQVGSLLDNNTHQWIPLSDGTLDLAALKAARAALKQADPDAPVALNAASKEEAFTGQDAMFDGSHVTLPPDLAAAVGEERATHLLLLTKHHGMASLEAADSHLGSGRIEGLGFYVDSDHPMKNLDTGSRTKGFLAPFAYVDVTLVDLSTSTIVRRSTILRSAVLSPPTNADSDGAGPWNSLTAAEKVHALGAMLREALLDAIPPVVSGAPAAAASAAR